MSTIKICAHTLNTIALIYQKTEKINQKKSQKTENSCNLKKMRRSVQVSADQ